jgi:3',5'-cyclic AMP phosphodiesterase CpdA
MFTLAHLSDPHLSPVPTPRFQELLGKRCLGYLSWSLRRKPIHAGPVLPALVADLLTSRPDHIAVTGDITNISLPGEFIQAAGWLAGLGDSRQVTAIPGNHDAYVPIPWERSWALWAKNMGGLDASVSGDERPVASVDDFPFVRLRGPLAIVGVSTAWPMPPHSAAGYIGEAQLRRLRSCLAVLAQKDICRVVLIHHPPLPGATNPRKHLDDAAAFRSVIAETGAELILFGHTHVSILGKLPTPAGEVPVIGVPSASARPHRHKDHARYHLYGIERDGPNWRIHVHVRGVAPSLDRFLTESRFSLTVPCPRPTGAAPPGLTTLPRAG